MRPNEEITAEIWKVLGLFLEEWGLMTKELSDAITTRNYEVISRFRRSVTNPSARDVLDTFCSGIECDESLRVLREACRSLSEALDEAVVALEATDASFDDLAKAHHGLKDSLAALKEWTV